MGAGRARGEGDEGGAPGAQRWKGGCLTTPAHSHHTQNTRSGYAPEKVAENVECEIMEVVAEEARLSYREEVVVGLPSNTLEDRESNRARVVAWVAAWERDNAARAGGGGGGGGGR